MSLAQYNTNAQSGSSAKVQLMNLFNTVMILSGIINIFLIIKGSMLIVESIQSTSAYLLLLLTALQNVISIPILLGIRRFFYTRPLYCLMRILCKVHLVFAIVQISLMIVATSVKPESCWIIESIQGVTGKTQTAQDLQKSQSIEPTSNSEDTTLYTSKALQLQLNLAYRVAQAVILGLILLIVRCNPSVYVEFLSTSLSSNLQQVTPEANNDEFNQNRRSRSRDLDENARRERIAFYQQLNAKEAEILAGKFRTVDKWEILHEVNFNEENIFSDDQKQCEVPQCIICITPIITPEKLQNTKSNPQENKVIDSEIMENKDDVAQNAIKLANMNDCPVKEAIRSMMNSQTAQEDPEMKIIKVLYCQSRIKNYYHLRCLKQWFMERQICPVCKDKSLQWTHVEHVLLSSMETKNGNCLAETQHMSLRQGGISTHRNGQEESPAESRDYGRQDGSQAAGPN
ncbi:hypothetical protein FGO68_gene9729 [Halteria grandinella]|uniref:Uncharacterized protein n=1 Tax=Halteria grandinella TaxID=5974 RepID=A0A8J8NT00_HALGN|nr:hypothetical protein FGO68_gene9729 [Halteria grandinella]